VWVAGWVDVRVCVWMCVCVCVLSVISATAKTKPPKEPTRS